MSELFQIGGFDRSKVRPGSYVFLLIEKGMFSLFGDEEWVWRLFPFLCSIAALFLFKKIAFAFSGEYAGTVSVALFAFSPSLIYYAAEAKPYGCEVLFTLVAWVLLAYIRQETTRRSGTIAAAFGCGFLVWASFAACFVLAAGILVVMAESFWQRQWGKLSKITGIGFFCLANFIAYYYLSLRYFTSSQGLLKYWEDGLLPLGAGIGSMLTWAWERGVEFMIFPGDLGIPALGALFLILGMKAWHQKNRFFLMLLIGPAALTFLAACLHKYPLAGRTVIFLTPSLYLLIGQGWHSFFAWERKYGSTVMALILLGVLLAHPLWVSAERIYNPPQRQEMKAVVQYIKNHMRAGDIIYVAGSARPIFCYYDDMMSVDRFIKGVFIQDDYRDVVRELQSLQQYRRVWLIYSDLNKDEIFVAAHLNQMGHKILTHQEMGCGCILYNIKR